MFSQTFFFLFDFFGSAVCAGTCATSATLCVLNVRLVLDGEDPQPLLGVIAYNRTVKTIESEEALVVIVHVVKGVKGASLTHSRHSDCETLI